MPFTKTGKDDYTSPKGNHFNLAQVRLYYANGGKFPGEKKARGGPVMPLQGARRVAAPPVRRTPPALATTPVVNRPVPQAGVPAPPLNKGYQGAPIGMAAGGPVLGRSLSFAKDEFTGGRLPPKQSVPVEQAYGNKGAPAKRTGDKSEPAVKPRK